MSDSKNETPTLTTETKLSEENYQKGFLVDEEFLAGVAPHPEQEGQFIAFVIRHETGEYVGFEQFPTAKEAIASINKVDREWSWQPLSPCGGGGCGGHSHDHDHGDEGDEGHGGCGGGGCGGCGGH